MLMPDPDRTVADQAAWDTLERYDRVTGGELPQRADLAIGDLAEFLHAHPDGIVGISWGKDSVVLAHLARRLDPNIPLVWVPVIRSDGTSYEDWGTYAVRDAFLDRCPGAYEERPFVSRIPLRGDPGYRPGQYRDEAGRPVPEFDQDALGESITEPYASGVRAEESRARTVAVARHGTVSTRTARPIGHWSGLHVFGYLAVHDLPVHRLYACSYGGRVDRRRLRVHTLRSWTPPVHDWDQEAWEDHYAPRLVEHRAWMTNAPDELSGEET